MRTSELRPIGDSWAKIALIRRRNSGEYHAEHPTDRLCDGGASLPLVEPTASAAAFRAQKGGWYSSGTRGAKITLPSRRPHSSAVAFARGCLGCEDLRRHGAKERSRRNPFERSLSRLSFDNPQPYTRKGFIGKLRSASQAPVSGDPAHRPFDRKRWNRSSTDMPRTRFWKYRMNGRIRRVYRVNKPFSRGGGDSIHPAGLAVPVSLRGQLAFAFQPPPRTELLRSPASATRRFGERRHCLSGGANHLPVTVPPGATWPFRR